MKPSLCEDSPTKSTTHKTGASHEMEKHIHPRADSAKDDIEGVEEHEQAGQTEESRESQLKTYNFTTTPKAQHAPEQLEGKTCTVSSVTPNHDLPIDHPDEHAFELAGAEERLAHKQMKLQKDEGEKSRDFQGDAHNEQPHHDIEPGDESVKRSEMHEDLTMLGVVGLEARKARDAHGMVRRGGAGCLLHELGE